jgi:23S rRNA pseudouridine1911/1915/1917 synthase
MSASNENDHSGAIVDSDDELYERLSFTIDPGQQPMRIDKWLHSRIENVSRNKIQKAIEQGFVFVNNQFAKANYKIQAGDTVLLMSRLNPELTEVQPEHIPLDIVFEDESILVLNKPAGLVVHPGVGNYTGTLLNGVAWHFLQSNPDLTEDNLPRYGMVHRIDKNTTGLLVLGKTADAVANLAAQFAKHSVQRKYTALVWGDVEADNGTVRAHIARHARHRKMFDAYPDGETGKHAVTHYTVVQRFNYVTLLTCRLETGRTHQIRVHMKHIGHTLFNDWEYGGDNILKGTVYTRYKQFVENCFELCPRCALHAGLLGFLHPATGKEMLFEQALPSDMQQLISKWADYVKAKPL